MLCANEEDRPRREEGLSIQETGLPVPEMRKLGWKLMAALNVLVVS